MNIHTSLNVPNLFQIIDDFLIGSNETGEIGLGSWSFSNGSVAWVNAIGAELGVIRRTSGTVVNQVAPFFLGDATNRALFTYQSFSLCSFWIRGVAVASDFLVRIGIMNDLGINPSTSGIYFERLATDTNWFIVVRNLSTQQRFDTGLAFNTTTLYKFRFIKRSNGNVDFFSGNNIIITITSDNINLPTSAIGLNVGVQIVPTTTTARSLDIDLIELNLFRN